MEHKRKTNGLTIPNREVAVIYPLLSDKQDLSPDFYIQLSLLHANGIVYRWLNYDLSAAGNNRMIEFTEQFKNNTIYLYIPDITYFNLLNNFLERLKENNCFNIAGGISTITVIAVEILNLFAPIDVIVRAPEAENVLVHLLNGIRENKALASIKGITFRQHGTDKIITTPGPPLSKDMDYFHGLRFPGLEISRDDWYPLVTSRGCNKNCQYCGLQVPYRMHHTGTDVWRARPVRRIVDEMERSISRGINKFSFYSEQFFKPTEASRTNGANGHAAKIAREILKRKLKPRLSFIAKASELAKNFDSLFILRDAGLENVDIGIDSGLDRFHRMYETGSSVQDNFDVLKQMHEHRFNFDISFVFFDPYLSIEEIERNLEFLEKISGYFSHLPKPYSRYLDSGVLDSVLILRHGMPIIQRLRKDNLVMESPGFSKHPGIKFKDPGVKKIYSIYRIIKKSVIPSIKPLYNNNASIEKNSSLNLIPLQIMRKIVTDVTGDRVKYIPQYVLETAAHLKNSVTAQTAADDLN